MNKHVCIAEFKGHKVRNEFKTVLRFYDNPIQPWTFLIYDEVYKDIITLPKEELYYYVFGDVFPKRRLFTTGREMENLFSKTNMSDRKLLQAPKFVNNVCFLKRKYSCGNINYAELSTLNPTIAKMVDWLSPHTCIEVKDNITDTTKNLVITVPEYRSVVFANPKYFDIKEKTR